MSGSDSVNWSGVMGGILVAGFFSALVIGIAMSAHSMVMEQPRCPRCMEVANWHATRCRKCRADFPEVTTLRIRSANRGEAHGE